MRRRQCCVFKRKVFNGEGFNLLRVKFTRSEFKQDNTGQLRARHKAIEFNIFAVRMDITADNAERINIGTTRRPEVIALANAAAIGPANVFGRAPRPPA